MTTQNIANVTPTPPEPNGTKTQYGTPVSPYLADQERMDRISAYLESKTGGEFRRPRVLARALDALEKELGPDFFNSKAA